MTMANSYVESLMGQKERILLVTRQHWFILFSRIFLEIILIVVLVAGFVAASLYYPVASLGFILVLVPLIGMVRDILIWSNRQYIVTNRRVIQVAGVFSKYVLDSSLEKVNDIKMNQTFLGRLFDYGDVQILTASELGIDLLERIANPIKFKTTMLNAKQELEIDADDLRVLHEDDIPTLIAKLDELRKQGIISEQEFQKKKAELLAKM
jgi:uncharacterized membrane protein YdbT with pleckstrin-like domain